MDSEPQYHDIGPIRINLHSLISSIRTHAIDWKNTLGGILAEKTVRCIKFLRDHMTVSFFIFSYFVFVFPVYEGRKLYARLKQKM